MNWREGGKEYENESMRKIVSQEGGRGMNWRKRRKGVREGEYEDDSKQREEGIGMNWRRKESE